MSDKRVLKVIRAFLVVSPVDDGTPPGSPLSPICIAVTFIFKLCAAWDEVA